MSCARSRKYSSVLAIAILGLWAATLAAQEKKNTAVIPLPRDQQKGWMERHEAINARVKQGNVDLLFIGDSITEGWEGDGKRVWGQFYGRRNAVNAGISSDRTQNVLWRLDHGNVDGISPKLAVLLIGTNTMGESPEQICEGIKAVVDKLREKLPKTKVLVLAILPRGKNNEAPTETNKLCPRSMTTRTCSSSTSTTTFSSVDGTPQERIDAARHAPSFGQRLRDVGRIDRGDRHDVDGRRRRTRRCPCRSNCPTRPTAGCGSTKRSMPA